ncbi:Fanconi anemia group I protein isoform X2 [Centruroides vittatus]|uniref:Fanconi anemia group I protein isoform X2 n=1 Tax=Centruroides vittatus TaxID=120091 RepID=UPI00350F12B3
MDKKLVQLYETGGELEKFLDNVDLKEIFKTLEEKINRGENVANIFKIIFQGSSSTASSAIQRRFDVYKYAISLLQSGDFLSEFSSDLIGLLLTETDNFPSSTLVEISESLINCLKTGKMPGNKWLEIVPKVLTTLTSRNIVSQNNIDMTGTEYRSHLIKCLCLNKWEPECAVQVASTFREIALSNEELQWLIEKLLKVLQEVEIQEIPTLVYQLLLLSSKGFRKQLLEKILFYFKNQADILKKQQLNKDRNKENESMHSVDTIKHIEGTVILHITFAAKQDQEIGKEFVKLLKNSQHQPEHLLSSFCIALALSIAKMQRFEEQIIDVLKHIVIYYFQENEKKTHSYWMREMLSANYNLSALILETIKTSKFGWDYVTQSLVKLGFTLMDSFGPKGTFGKIPDIGVFHTAYTPNENASSLGAEILQETFKIHETVREEILQQILNRVITKTSRPVFHYIDVIAKTIKAAPQQLLDILRKFREILDYVPFLPYPSAITFLRALTPLLKISSPLKDALMVVLRKALFHREIDARKVAISGFLIVLRNFKLLEGSGSQNSYSQSSISLSQVRIEVHMNHQPGSFEALCLELLGTLRRVFTQQSDIRSLLYEGLHEVLCRNLQLSDAIFELLMNQFEKYYEKDKEISPPLKLESCIDLKYEEITIIEPLPHLLTCIQLCVSTILQKTSNDDDDDCEQSTCFNFLKSSLDHLTKRIISTDFEDFDLDCSSDFSTATSVGRRNHLIASLLLGVHEALMEYTFSTGNISTESCNSILSLYIAYKKLEELIKEKQSNGKKEGKGKGKKSNNLMHKLLTSVLTLKFISDILYALFCDDNSDHQDGLVILRGTELDFSQHFVNLACSRIVQFQEKGKCIGIRKNSEDTFKCFFVIGKALYQQIQTDDNSTLSSSCLNCLMQLFTLFCNHYPHQLQFFLQFLEHSSCEADNTLHCLIIKYIEIFKNFINLSSLSESNQKDTIYYLNIISMLCKHINPNEQSKTDIWSWIKKLCVDEEICETNVAKVLFSLYLNLGRQDAAYVTLLRDVTHVIHYKLGDIDEDVEVHQSKEFALANETTSMILLPIIIQHLDYILDDIEWVLASIKTEVAVKCSLDRQNKEKSICNQFGHLISACNELVQTALAPGTCTEVVMKFLTKMYNSLSSFTKYYLSIYNQKVGEICSKFEKMVRLSGTHLTPQVYSMISYLQASDNKGKKRKRNKVDCVAEKAKVLRETKIIPQLIFAIEQYERHLIQLSKKSKVNLMEHIKLATSRDFRINIETVQAALENELQSDNSEVTIFI